MVSFVCRGTRDRGLGNADVTIALDSTGKVATMDITPA
jgi:hypothetical protein